MSEWLKKKIPAGWSVCIVRGGAHDGAKLRVPDDLDALVLRRGGKRHEYQRAGASAFVSADRLAGMFGKGARR